MNRHSKENFFQLRPGVKPVDTSVMFTVRWETEKLRVTNENVNCLFSNLDPQSFNEAYNIFLQHLNPDFEPLMIDGVAYALNSTEQECFVQRFITNWIYYYTINNLDIKVCQEDFDHPYTADYLLPFIDEKYGPDTSASLALGAKILRMDTDLYAKLVAYRRWYYDR